MNTVRSPLEVTLSVWKALFLREAVTRLATGRAAWLWLLLEPVAQVVMLMVVFSVIRKGSYQGVDFALYLAIGVIGFSMFKNSAQRAIDAIPANAALFAYRQVKPVDAVLVRSTLDGLIEFLVALALLAGSALAGMDVIPHDPVGVILVFFLLWLFGTGFGLILSVGSELIPEIGKVARLMFTPLYFVSGVMFSPHLLPPAVRDWVVVNPVMHGIELMREAFFASYPPLVGIDSGYLAIFALGAFLLGLALHVRFARRLVEQ